MSYTSKHKVFRTRFKEDWGQDLGDFLNDPEPEVSGGYGEGPSRCIEAVQGRAWKTLGNLLALLVDKGVITLKEAFQVTDIDWDVENRITVREKKEGE